MNEWSVPKRFPALPPPPPPRSPSPHSSSVSFRLCLPGLLQHWIAFGWKSTNSYCPPQYGEKVWPLHLNSFLSDRQTGQVLTFTVKWCNSAEWDDSAWKYNALLCSWSLTTGLPAGDVLHGGDCSLIAHLSFLNHWKPWTGKHKAVSQTTGSNF